MILVDLETTDLPNDITQDPEQQPGIVQIGLIELDDAWNEVASFESLVNPEKPPHLWDAKAIATHGITPEKVVDAPTLPSLLPGMAHRFRRHDCWVGFNNPFDRKVLFYQVMRYGWQWKFPWPSRDLDVMQIATPVINMQGKRDVKPPKLVELHQHLMGVGFENAHDALADCRATMRCGRSLWQQGLI